MRRDNVITPLLGRDLAVHLTVTDALDGASRLLCDAQRFGFAIRSVRIDVLKDELDEGRDLYRSRVSQEVLTTTNFFDRAVVDIIVRGKAHVRSKIW